MISGPILDVRAKPDQLTFEYGQEAAGPTAEFRSLDPSRPSLLDPHCSGPDLMYGIAMDVARESDHRTSRSG